MWKEPVPERVKPLLQGWVLWPAVAVVVVWATGLAVKDSAVITGAEYRIGEMLGRHQSSPFDDIAQILNIAFSAAHGPWVAALVCVAVWAMTRSRAKTAAAALIIAFSCAICWLMKILVSRLSPGTDDLWISYPSGHTAFAMADAAAIYLLTLQTRWSRLVFRVGAAMVVAVAVSRLYLGVHYLSDVLAGGVLSAACAAFAYGLWNTVIEPIRVGRGPILLSMGNLLEAVRRIHSAVKLRRGQCDTCRGILRDDERRWCSQECHDTYWEANAV